LLFAAIPSDLFVSSRSLECYRFLLLLSVGSIPRFVPLLAFTDFLYHVLNLD
jgi:hypothetical protein